MQQIPIQQTPSQVVSVILANQNCQISLYQKSTGIFFDLRVNDRPVVTTRLVRNTVPLVRQRYLGFVGDLIVMDMQGNKDPEYTGLGSRYMLYYLEATDL
ncbi:phage baseplate plug protein [Acinetobacter sp.]|uniref:phage baseplate plug family protein n=1 Tax=Acinetobacter TaxID=469 RepID=UPI003916FD7D